MTRSSRTPRRLVVGDETFLWAVGHEHREEQGRFLDCREVLTVRRPRALGRLRIVFEARPGHLVPDGGPYTHSGSVGTDSAGWLNLHEPGTVRALLDEITARGGRVGADATETVDGWTLVDAVSARRSDRSDPGSVRP
jgi:hypothetical protein